MALCVPKPGARLGADDPYVKSTEELITGKPQIDHNFEGRQTILYSQVDERLKKLPQSE